MKHMMDISSIIMDRTSCICSPPLWPPFYSHSYHSPVHHLKTIALLGVRETSYVLFNHSGFGIFSPCFDQRSNSSFFPIIITFVVNIFPNTKLLNHPGSNATSSLASGDYLFCAPCPALLVYTCIHVKKLMIPPDSTQLCLTESSCLEHVQAFYIGLDVPSGEPPGMENHHQPLGLSPSRISTSGDDLIPQLTHNLALSLQVGNSLNRQSGPMLLIIKVHSFCFCTLFGDSAQLQSFKNFEMQSIESLVFKRLIAKEINLILIDFLKLERPLASNVVPLNFRREFHHHIHVAVWELAPLHWGDIYLVVVNFLSFVSALVGLYCIEFLSNSHQNVFWLSFSLLCKKNMINCMQLTCNTLQPSFHSSSTFCTVTVHQSLVESPLEHGWSNNRSFLGISACQLQGVEQVLFAVTLGKPSRITCNTSGVLKSIINLNYQECIVFVSKYFFSVSMNLNF
ncbi:hypothetical protein VP01_1393g5 [Puccinia sorghi]|uniref:Uncharacterized protein n=1 Tax=Puccinia sorghi TaxID=27349 RepID=A0A0L6VL44_9BASI|nr:hypothetical protein VP01_1393g5 [Puccinia sorghi]